MCVDYELLVVFSWQLVPGAVCVTRGTRRAARSVLSRNDVNEPNLGAKTRPAPNCTK